MIAFRAYKKDVINIKDAIFNPRRSYRKIEETPRLLIIWLFCGFSITVLNHFTNFFAIKSIRSYYQTHGYSAEFITNVINIWTEGRFFSTFLNPALLFVKWSIIALVLRLLLKILSDIKPNSYKRILSLIGHAELIYLISSSINLIILYIKGIESIHHPEDVQSSFGLDLFFHSGNLIINKCLVQLNFFDIWWLIFILRGFFIFFRIPKRIIIFIVLFIWVIIAAIKVIFALITSVLQSGMQ